MEDLVWKASRLPGRFKFVNRSDIRDSLESLDEEWKMLSVQCADKIELFTGKFSPVNNLFQVSPLKTVFVFLIRYNLIALSRKQ